MLQATLKKLAWRRAAEELGPEAVEEMTEQAVRHIRGRIGEVIADPDAAKAVGDEAERVIRESAEEIAKNLRKEHAGEFP